MTTINERIELITASLVNMRNPQIGLNHVKIMATDKPCEHCASLNGRIITIEQALRTMPVPATSCKHGYCRCYYEAVFDDEL